MQKINDLMHEFGQVSDDQWREKIIADLNIQEIEKDLVFQDENEIRHLPYYRKSSLKQNKLIEEIQLAQQKSHSWRFVQQFPTNYNQLEKAVKKTLNEGADEVVISEIQDLNELNKRFKTPPKEIPNLHLQLKKLANNPKPKMIFCDPIGEMVKNGVSDENEMDHLKQLFQKRLNQLKPDNFLLVDGSIYKNAGATVVQELTLSLRHAVEYLDSLTEAGFRADAVARSFTFKLGYGSSFFTEIAKSRAFRYLIKKIFKAYETDANIRLWGESGTYYLSHLDPYTNLLRITGQCMSAAIGGCDLISCPPFDSLEEASGLGYRMSKNCSLILKHESHLHQVNDLSKGSYYIESLSCSLADEAWNLFLKAEDGKSFFSEIDDGTIKDELIQSHKKRVKKYKEGEKIMIGVNQYQAEAASELKVKSHDSKGVSSLVLSKAILS